MNKIPKKIMQLVRHRGSGCVFTPKDFIGFGSRMAIDTALSRLVANGYIHRVARGLYHYPKKNYLLGNLYPSLDNIIAAITKDAGSRIQVSGAQALHLLGLTTQVPAQIIYLTDGQSKNIRIGKTILTLKHASTKIMAGSGSKAGLVLQAIRYLGKTAMNDDFFNTVSSQLGLHDKKILKQIIRYAPQWAKPTIDKLLAA